MLEGRKILLAYCPHNTINFIGQTLSALGAECEFFPVGPEYCKAVIEGQDHYDAIINCGCAFEVVPQEEINTYCCLLTKPLVTVTHSYWEPTYNHPQIITLRKPVMVNELLAVLSKQLLPRVKDYEVYGGAVLPDSAIFIAPETTRIQNMVEGLEKYGYSISHITSVTKGIDAIQIYRPEIVFIDTCNITLDSYWLTQRIREMEAAEQLMPVRIIILSGKEYEIPSIQVDDHTIVIEHFSTVAELHNHVIALRNQHPAVQIA